MKYFKCILLFCLFGCATNKVVDIAPPNIFTKLSSAEPQVISIPVKPIKMIWPDDNDVNAWVVVEADSPSNLFQFYAITTHNFVLLYPTNGNRFYNYCRSQDYIP